MRILEEGKADYFKVDPDGYRAFVRDNKPHLMAPKLITHAEAVEKFVHDGDYLAYDCNYFQRGPSSLIREIIRQRRKNLWLCGKFTYVACALLVEADSCEPRYPGQQALMEAASAPIEKWGLAGLGLHSEELLSVYRKLPRAASPRVLLVDLLVRASSRRNEAATRGTGSCLPSTA